MQHYRTVWRAVAVVALLAAVAFQDPAFTANSMFVHPFLPNSIFGERSAHPIDSCLSAPEGLCHGPRDLQDPLVQSCNPYSLHCRCLTQHFGASACTPAFDEFGRGIGTSPGNPIRMQLVGDLFHGSHYSGLHRCRSAYCDVQHKNESESSWALAPDVVFFTTLAADMHKMRHPLAATVGTLHNAGSVLQNRSWPDSGHFWFAALAGYSLNHSGPYASFNSHEPWAFRRKTLVFAQRRSALLLLQKTLDATSAAVVSKINGIVPMDVWDSNEVQNAFPHCFASHLSRELVVDCLLHHYTMFLHVEDSWAPERMPGQVYAGLARGAIPVYFGAPDIITHFPSRESVVLVRDFETAQQLAEYLNLILRDEETYNWHMRWRHMAFNRNFLNAITNPLQSLPCKLCDAFAAMQPFAGPQVNTLGDRLVLSPCVVQRLRSATFYRNWVQPRPEVDALDVQTYVATVLSAVERHELLRDRMARVGLRGDAMFAFDSISMSAQDRMCFEADAPTDGRQRLPLRRWSDGEISLAIKHVAIAWDIWLNGIDFALVLEDDAVFAAEFPSVLQSVLADVPSGWDFIVIGGCLDIHNTDERVSAYLYHFCQTRCTHGYIISYSGARKLLQSLPIRMPIDFQIWSMCDESDLKSYLVEPPQIFQDEDMTSMLRDGRGF